MPHKKAKRAVREQVRNQKGTDLAPSNESLRNEAIPKSAIRAFNAEKVREEWKLKRKQDNDGEGGHSNGKRRKLESGEGETVKRKEKLSHLTIKPGESMQHFNKRVESDMRPLVRNAIQTSNAFSRNNVKQEMEAKALAKKAKQKAKESEAEPPKSQPKPVVASPTITPIDKHAGRPKDFVKTSASAPRRLNDIALAPPEFKKLPRGAVSGGGFGNKDGVLSMMQKSMMEQEREKAIARYREMKAERRAAAGGGDA